MKSFDSESLSYLESLDAEDALRCIANAIPAKLLEAVYRTCIECFADEASSRLLTEACSQRGDGLPKHQGLDGPR